MIEKLENELIGQIKKAVEGKIAVRPYPKDPSAYKLSHKSGEALVRYLGSDYTDRSTDGYLQKRTMRYEIVGVFRDLRSPWGAQGGYGVLDAIREHLSGVVLHGARTFCQIESDRFVGEHDGIWQWGIQISFQAFVALKLPEETSAPLRLASV